MKKFYFEFIAYKNNNNCVISHILSRIKCAVIEPITITIAYGDSLSLRYVIKDIRLEKVYLKKFLKQQNIFMLIFLRHLL